MNPPLNTSEKRAFSILAVVIFVCVLVTMLSWMGSPKPKPPAGIARAEQITADTVVLRDDKLAGTVIDCPDGHFCALADAVVFADDKIIGYHYQGHWTFYYPEEK